MFRPYKITTLMHFLDRRQKKYYARLKEKKQGGDFQEGPHLESGGFPIRGSFDSTPSSD